MWFPPGIIVAQRDVRGRSPADAESAPRSSEVAACRHDLDLRELLSHRAKGAIGGSVIDDDDFGLLGKLNVPLQRAEYFFPPIVGEDDDRYSRVIRSRQFSSSHGIKAPPTGR